MAKKTYTKETLPEILTAQHISDYLGISRAKIYELFHVVGGIPNFDIGTSRRVEKQDFLNWIESRKKQKTAS